MTGCHHPLACQNLINSLDFQANQATHWKQNDSPCACTTSSPGACPMFFTVTSTHAAAWHPSLICWGSENLSLKQISPRANDVQYGNVSLKKNPYIYIPLQWKSVWLHEEFGSMWYLLFLLSLKAHLTTVEHTLSSSKLVNVNPCPKGKAAFTGQFHTRLPMIRCFNTLRYKTLTHQLESCC